MADVLIRGLSDAAMHALMPTPPLRVCLARNTSGGGSKSNTPAGGLTIADLHRAAEAAADLDDPDVMDCAWR